MFGQRPEGSEGISMGQLRRCPVVSAGSRAKTCLVCRRSVKEARVAGTAWVRRAEAGAEVREAGDQTG